MSINFDPAIEDVRKTRRVISKRYGNDARKLVLHYMELEKDFKGKMAKKPKKASPLLSQKSEG